MSKSTTASLSKRADTKLRLRAKWDAQTIVIDKHWLIRRADQLNWEIQFKGEFAGYFGSLSSAFQALAPKMLGEEAKGSLEALIDLHRDINRRVATALPAAERLLSARQDPKPA
jgi:hypothetical protein